MNRAFVVCLLLQAVCGKRNISISINVPQENPADVTYVDGRAPDELKAGPVKNTTTPLDRITHAAFIRSNNREIPKDDEIENEEFERFIKEHHSQPTIETVFVSTSPSSVTDQDAENLEDDSSSLRSQAEFFKRPAQYKTFERSVALPTVPPSILPTSDHSLQHTLVNHQAQDVSAHNSQFAYPGGDGIVFQGNGGGHYSGFTHGQYQPNYQDFYSGGGQQYYHVSQPVHVPPPVPRTINVAQQAVKTKTFEIRRPAIQKHYYDIEERVIIRPAGSIVVELDRPVAKVPTGENIVPVGGLQGEYSVGGYGHSQSSYGIVQGAAQGGFSGISYSPTYATPTPSYSIGGSDFQHSQGGLIYSTASSYQPSTPAVSVAPKVGYGFQQTQGSIGVSQVGVQHAQGGVSVSTTVSTPTSTVSIGGSHAASGVTVAQGVSHGSSGVTVQQSQGGVVYSTTPAPYLPPATPTPTIGIGASHAAGVSYQQSQGSISVSQGAAAHQSQGGLVFSTTGTPFIQPVTPRPTVAIGASQGGFTAGSAITTTPVQHFNNDGGIVVEAKTNVQNKNTFSSSTTTERSFSSTINQDASTYTRGSSSGAVQGVNNNITPYMITVGEPDFHYPPYVEINSNGSPLGHLHQQPFSRVQASQAYPRMRYQGQLLTGELRTDGAFSQNQDSTYKTPANVAEIPPNAPYEEKSSKTEQQQQHQTSNFAGPQQGEPQANTQHQFVGSTQQPLQDSQSSGGVQQQPSQVHQRHYVSLSSRPVHVSDPGSFGGQQHYQGHQQPIYVQRYRTQQPAHFYRVSQPSYFGSPNNQQYVPKASPQQKEAVSQDQQQAVDDGKQQVSDTTQQQIIEDNKQQNVVENPQPVQFEKYRSQEPTRGHQQQTSQFREQPVEQQPQRHAAYVSQRPNLVQQIRHQHLAQVKQQDEVNEQNYVPQNIAEPTQQPTEEDSSTLRQFNVKYQQQFESTDQQPESFAVGKRLYHQKDSPAKYTQHHTLNFAPSRGNVHFSYNQEKVERSQNLETPPEEVAYENEATLESSTANSDVLPQQTYASVLATSKPGILYASSGHAVPCEHPSHSKQNLRFNSEGSSLFSPSGRQVHFVYAQAPRAAYTQESRGDISPTAHHISYSNAGLKAQIPITHERQIQLSASNDPDPVSEPKESKSQAQEESQRTSARYETISSTTPAALTSDAHQQARGQQKYRNEQKRSGSLTLRSGRTYGTERVIASTPAPSDGGSASESVQTRRIVVNHPFQTVQEVVEQEPITSFHQVTVNEPAQVHHADLQQDQQKAPYRRHPAAFNVAATHNRSGATLSYHHGGSH